MNKKGYQAQSVGILGKDEPAILNVFCGMNTQGLINQPARIAVYFQKVR